MTAVKARRREHGAASPSRRAWDEARLPGWVSALLIGGTFAGLVWLELRRPLRGHTESKLRRTARNLAVAACSAAALQFSDAPVTGPLTTLVARKRWGLVRRLGLSRPAEVLLMMLALDYSLYLWHVAFHKVPWLWRFHQVHHVDLDLDTSTGIRFHFGEMVLSLALRTAQILLIGVTPLAMSIWNTWLLMEVMFHHSNVELPCRFERWLGKFIVTPRMHGIHHSIVPEETNSNWSSGLTLWDWLHGTLRLNVPQRQIVIGVPAYRDPQELTVPKLTAMPFTEQRDPWHLPNNGIPTRQPGPVDPDHLLP